MADEIEQEAGEATPDAAPAALTATPAAEWPSKDKMLAGVVVEMPSGGVARLRNPPLQYLLATGRVPPKLWSRLHKEGTAVLIDPLRMLETDEVKVFIDWMIAESFVEPKVSMARKAGTVFIGDIVEEDKQYVMAEMGLSLTG